MTRDKPAATCRRETCFARLTAEGGVGRHLWRHKTVNINGLKPDLQVILVV